MNLASIFIILILSSCNYSNKTKPLSNSYTGESSITLDSNHSNKPLSVSKDSISTDFITTVDTTTPPTPKEENRNSNSIKETPISSLEESKSYPWLEDYQETLALIHQIPPPEGYKRLSMAEQSFGSWLRKLPLHPKGTKVMLYDGTEKPYQAGAFRVINIDIGKRDLQQCADAVMRLKAEYHYAQREYESIHFNYTSGHTIRFSDWSKGKKPKIKGSKVSFTSPSGFTDNSYKQFKKYLTNVYCYAGTASLSKELRKKEVKDILPGDVFIWGGFPGHAIIVMDVAIHKETGKKVFLLAQSYMPAQNIHILNNFNSNELSPWYSEDFGQELQTPEWNFDRTALKSFVD